MAAVCAVDIGTTRVKALLLSQEGVPGPASAVPSVLSTPAPGAAEVDADALWGQTVAAVRAACEARPAVEGLAISNQRATVFLVDGRGAPLRPGLSWQDGRGRQELAAWLEQVGEDRFTETTGLVPSTLWSLARILWWQRRGLPRGARIATVQDLMLRRLGATEWVLDHANASLTGLMDVRALSWDGGLVWAAGLSPGMLPSLAPSGRQVGRLSHEAAAATGLAPGTPLILGGGDQQCSVLGAGVVDRGVVAADLGTAAAIDVPVDRVTLDAGRRLVCLAHVVPGRWLLEGLENSYGGALHWGQDLLGEELPGLAASAPVGSRGLIFLPYLAGSGAPDYDPAARGAAVGLTLAHGRADLARAILEGSTAELVRILNAARELAPVGKLVASGGGARIPLLLEMLADLATAPVAPAAYSETGLVGAGLLAWVGVGRWPDAMAAASALPQPGEIVAPGPHRAAASRDLYARYRVTLAGLRESAVLSAGGDGRNGAAERASAGQEASTWGAPHG